MAEFEYLTTNRNEEENNMGEFYDIAASILERIEEQREGVFRDDEREILEYGGEENITRRGLTIDQIRRSVYNIASEDINFYPGMPGAPCYDLAVFVSLISPSHARGSKHLRFRKALEMIIQHAENTCPKTESIAFVTDSWDPKAFEEWKGMLEKVSQRVHFEIYLLANRDILQIKV